MQRVVVELYTKWMHAICHQMKTASTATSFHSLCTLYRPYVNIFLWINISCAAYKLERDFNIHYLRAQVFSVWFYTTQTFCQQKKIHYQGYLATSSSSVRSLSSWRHESIIRSRKISFASKSATSVWRSTTLAGIPASELPRLLLPVPLKKNN